MDGQKRNDDHNNPESGTRPPSLWVNAQGVISILFIVVILLYLPWSYYCRHTLLRDDGQGIAAFLGVLSLLNALALLVRVRLVEETNTSWMNIKDNNVSMAADSMSNVLFFAGLSLWFVCKDLGISKVLCYFLALTGTMGHAVMHHWRWRVKRASSDGVLTTAYAIMTVALTLAMLGAMVIHDGMS